MAVNEDNLEKMCNIAENLAKWLKMQLTVISPSMTRFPSLSDIIFLG